MASEFFKISNIQELNGVSARLHELVQAHTVVIFSGEMGAGKTTLIKHFCRHLGVADEVSSPTFSLVNEYRSDRGPVYHFDLYRLNNQQELFDIGYEDYFFSGYLCLIEWPEMALELIPNKHITVNILVENEQRVITVTHPK